MLPHTVRTQGAWGGKLLWHCPWQAAWQILRMKRHNSGIELGLWRQTCERGMERRWQEKLRLSLRILKAAVAMLAKVSLALFWTRIIMDHVEDKMVRVIMEMKVVRANLMQVRQAALLNCLLLVFMGDLNWWARTMICISIFFKFEIGWLCLLSL